MQAILFVFSIASGVFLLAGLTQNHGWYLADQLCSQGAVLCDNPLPLLVVTGIVLLVAMVRAVAKI